MSSRKFAVLSFSIGTGENRVLCMFTKHLIAYNNSSCHFQVCMRFRWVSMLARPLPVIRLQGRGNGAQLHLLQPAERSPRAALRSYSASEPLEVEYREGDDSVISGIPVAEPRSPGRRRWGPFPQVCPLETSAVHSDTLHPQHGLIKSCRALQVSPHLFLLSPSSNALPSHVTRGLSTQNPNLEAALYTEGRSPSQNIKGSILLFPPVPLAEALTLRLTFSPTPRRCLHRLACLPQPQQWHMLCHTSISLLCPPCPPKYQSPFKAQELSQEHFPTIPRRNSPLSSSITTPHICATISQMEQMA